LRRRSYILRLFYSHIFITQKFPWGEGIPEAVDADSRAGYWRQEENSMWVRAALIAEIFGKDI